MAIFFNFHMNMFTKFYDFRKKTHFLAMAHKMAIIFSSTSFHQHILWEHFQQKGFKPLKGTTICHSDPLFLKIYQNYWKNTYVRKMKDIRNLILQCTFVLLHECKQQFLSDMKNHLVNIHAFEKIFHGPVEFFFFFFAYIYIFQSFSYILKRTVS